MSLVDLGKRLLEAARKGQDDEVRNLMANGAPFTTDWVRLCMLFLNSTNNGMGPSTGGTVVSTVASQQEFSSPCVCFLPQDMQLVGLS